jgi:hypothetical protein
MIPVKYTHSKVSIFVGAAELSWVVPNNDLERVVKQLKVESFSGSRFQTIKVVTTVQLFAARIANQPVNVDQENTYAFHWNQGSWVSVDGQLMADTLKIPTGMDDPTVKSTLDALKEKEKAMRAAAAKQRAELEGFKPVASSEPAHEDDEPITGLD